MTCQLIADEWDWKLGDPFTQRIGDIDVPMNYFSCGQFLFDGLFKTVKFPKGMTLYHTIVKDHEFPIGDIFYKPVGDDEVLPPNFIDAVNNSNESVQGILGDFIPASHGWFTDPRSSKIIGNDTRLAAFKLIKDVTFIILDDPFNIYKLSTVANMPDNIKLELKSIYGFDTFEPKLEIDNLLINDKRVLLAKKHSDILAAWLCANISKAMYAGYTINLENIGHEYIFCSPLEVLERDLTNKLDWRYSAILPEPLIGEFLKQMSYYKTTNINFHAGNLLEHSIWSLLYIEKLLENPNKYITYNEAEKRAISSIALIQNLGKMTPSETTVRQRDCIYFTIPNSSELGKEYILGEKSMPMLNNDMSITKNISIPRLLKVLRLGNPEVVAKFIKYHMEFGRRVSRFPAEGIVVVDEYINLVGKESEKFYYTLLLLSTADIYASQPYSVENFVSPINTTSKYFPFISNVPKNYRGRKITKEARIIQDKFGTAIMDRIIFNNKSAISISDDEGGKTSPMVTAEQHLELPVPGPVEKVESVYDPPQLHRRAFPLKTRVETDISSDSLERERIERERIERDEREHRLALDIERLQKERGPMEYPYIPKEVIPPLIKVKPVDWVNNRLTIGKLITNRLNSTKISQWKTCLSGHNKGFRNTITTTVKILGKGSFGQVYLIGIMAGKVIRNVVVKEVILSGEDKQAMASSRYITSGGFNKNAWPIEFKFMEMMKTLLTTSTCPNFLDSYHLAACEGCEITTLGGTTSGLCYTTFMEPADGDLKRFQPQITTVDGQFSCCYQLLAALHAVQYVYGIIHNDIKTVNIMVQQTPQLKGKYFIYVMNGRQYYVLNTGFVYYLADFGVAASRKPMWATDEYFGERNAKLIYRSGKYLWEPFTTTQTYAFVQTKLARKPEWAYIRALPIDWADYKNGTRNMFMKDRQSYPSIEVDLNDTHTFPPWEFYSDVQDILRMFIGGSRTTQPGDHAGFSRLTAHFRKKIKDFTTFEDKPYKHLWNKTQVSYILADLMFDSLYTAPKNDVRTLDIIGTYKIS